MRAARRETVEAAKRSRRGSSTRNACRQGGKRPERPAGNRPQFEEVVGDADLSIPNMLRQRFASSRSVPLRGARTPMTMQGADVRGEVGAFSPASHLPVVSRAGSTGRCALGGLRSILKPGWHRVMDSNRDSSRCLPGHHVERHLENAVSARVAALRAWDAKFRYPSDGSPRRSRASRLCRCTYASITGEPPCSYESRIP